MSSILVESRIDESVKQNELCIDSNTYNIVRETLIFSSVPQNKQRKQNKTTKQTKV